MQKNIKCKTTKHRQNLNRTRKQNKLHTNAYGFLKYAHAASKNSKRCCWWWRLSPLSEEQAIQDQLVGRWPQRSTGRRYLPTGVEDADTCPRRREGVQFTHLGRVSSDRSRELLSTNPLGARELCGLRLSEWPWLHTRWNGCGWEKGT